MTLKDLAKLLQLSPTTVSRALNGYTEVSEATRLRVAEAAKTHGYQPNVQARKLATGRAMAIGHVIPLSQTHEMVNPTFTDMLSGAGEIYAAQGYDILMAMVPEADQEATYRSMVRKRTVDGFIVHGAQVDDRRIDLLRELGLPFVVHGRAGENTDAYSWVDADHYRGFRRATEHLLALGHRCIALVNGVETMDFAHRRRQGFEAAFIMQGLPVPHQYMTSGEMTEHQGYDAAAEMLSWADRPTAIVTSSLISAMGARRAIEEAGEVMGKTISVITFDDEIGFLKNGYKTPMFSAMQSPVRVAGRRAAQMLIDQIETRDFAPRRVLLEPVLLLGPSCGPVALHDQN
ncbi:LacI family transcriptional regulator [Rhodobacteraceae bacterium]|nr:LacI family transcriptional regulator [Paracoccaceae bacterium]